MTNKVSTSEIYTCEDYLNTIIKKLSTSFSNIQNNITEIDKSINCLKEYDKTKASYPTQRIVVKNNKKLIEEYQKKWKITITNEEKISPSLNSSVFNTIEDNLILLEENSILLGQSATKIDELIIELTNILGGKSISEMYQDGTFLEYLKNYKNISQISKINLEEIKKDGYTIQGITTISGEILVTAYSKNKEEYSNIYLYSSDGNFKGKIKLNNRAHVGGITYDKNNKILYVSGGKGKINAYSYESLSAQLVPGCTSVDLKDEQLDLADIIIKTSNLTVGTPTDETSSLTKVGKASSIYYYDDSLYVSTFDGINEGEMVKFDIEYKNNKLYASNEITYPIPPRTQGIAITEYDNKTYLVTTQSIGITNSTISLAEIKNTGLVSIGKTDINASGIQGISIDDSNNIVFSYENYDGLSGTADTVVDSLCNRNNDSITTMTFKTLKENIESSQPLNPVNKTISDIAGLSYNINHDIPIN